MNTTVNLQPLRYNNIRTYIYAALFIAGNMVLPQLVHAIPKGGPTFLPIYFFTLIAAYRYGLLAGLLTAIGSPFINHLFFGMPPTHMLPVLLSKSILLAISAAWAAAYFKKVTITSLILVVLAYQLSGSLVEWLLIKDAQLAIQDFRLGLPGILIQIVGGYFLLKYLSTL